MVFYVVFFKFVVWLLFIVYIIIPLLILMFPNLQTKFVFFYIYKCPLFSEFDNFKLFNLTEHGSRNFYLANGDIKLGVWHILPKSVVPPVKISDEKFELLLSNNKPVVLYFHGNALNRGGHHIVSLYKVLQDMDYHIVAVDYRGYGDSSGTPYCEIDLVSDAMVAFNYVKSKIGKNKLFIWGHSLGTGISSHVAKLLNEENYSPTGIILEAPFNNIHDAASEHPFGQIFKFMPYFEAVFLSTLKKNNIHFDSVANLRNVRSPILIVHSEDDHMVPFKLGKKLFDSLKKLGSNVRMEKFSSGKGYFHKHLWMSSRLRKVVTEFVGRHSET